ncbi:heme peroxidase 2-like [Penaeus japonicus]|uniref:heme peroxidase 2-like n=1 Tax=Penaeus japonicus TaxID=27405 RepID=UPI001C70E39F|nr:heme peroxidase 2-like [Penaeus japonicus]
MKLLHRRTCQSPVDHRKGRTCSIIKETRMIRTTILKICLFAMLLSSGCSLAAAPNVQRDDQASVRPVILESHHGNQPQLSGIQSGILQENILPLNLPLNTLPLNTLPLNALPLNTIRPSYEAIGDVTIGEDQNGSPYYLDPERRPPSHPPHMTAEDLHSEVKKCDTDYQGPCRPTEKYRNHNGRCNNLHFPEFGAVNQPMPRILPPVLHDAFFKINSVSGGLLPNPREVSLAMRRLPQAKPTENNIMFMQIGQFIDHDFVLTPVVEGHDGKPLDCKDCNSWVNPGCVPIPIPRNDPFISNYDPQTGKSRCLPFTRSAVKSRPSGFGRKTVDQININTGFLDLSTVYGVSDCRMNRLRLYANGHMAETRVMSFEKGVLPLVPGDLFEDCRTKHGKCFLAGDDRSNEHLGIMVTHMLYLREHNRIAMKLSEVNPHWDDERIYQVARQINIAQYQHTIYAEFIPSLIGYWKAKEYGLLPKRNGYSDMYDSRVNPGVANEFASSAFRLGHTMIPDDFRMLDKDYKPVSSFPLVETFHNTSMVFPMRSTDYLVRGMVGSRLKPVDLKLVDIALDRLFEKLGVPHSGEDLFARNIARGRDHGIASYTTYRKFCGLGPTSNFDDLRSTMSEEAITTFRQVYASVHDIDLYVGGLAEKPLPGALVGPTFACITAFQFLNSKRGDRYWYENKEAGFSYVQLHAIRSTASFANVFCENMAEKGNHKMPPQTLRLPCNRKNPLIPCSRLRKLDLSLWAETPPPVSKVCTYMSSVYVPGAPVSVSPCLSCVCHSNGELQCTPVPRGCGYPGMDEYCKLYCEEIQYRN